MQKWIKMKAYKWIQVWTENQGSETTLAWVNKLETRKAIQKKLLLPPEFPIGPPVDFHWLFLDFFGIFWILNTNTELRFLKALKLLSGAYMAYQSPINNNNQHEIKWLGI